MYLYVNCCRGFYLLYMETENFFILALFDRFSLFLTPFLIFLSVFRTLPAYCQAFPAFSPLNAPFAFLLLFARRNIFSFRRFSSFRSSKIDLQTILLCPFGQKLFCRKKFFSQYPPKIIGVPTATLSARTAICRLIFRPLSITPPFNRGE